MVDLISYFSSSYLVQWTVNEWQQSAQLCLAPDRSTEARVTAVGGRVKNPSSFWFLTQLSPYGDSALDQPEMIPAAQNEPVLCFRPVVAAPVQAALIRRARRGGQTGWSWCGSRAPCCFESCWSSSPSLPASGPPTEADLGPGACRSHPLHRGWEACLSGVGGSWLSSFRSSVSMAGVLGTGCLWGLASHSSLPLMDGSRRKTQHLGCCRRRGAGAGERILCIPRGLGWRL